LDGMDRPVVPVTVVVPVLNEADSLPALLEALLEQAYTPAEIIFTDAGSVDATRELIEQWAARGQDGPTALHLLRCPGALPGGGRNHGIRAATQPWIAFVDGGLVPEPDWLQKLFEYVRDGAGRAAFGLCQFGATDPMPRALCAITNGYLARRPVVPASIFHREIFEQAGLFREDLRTAEDMVWVRNFERHFGPRPICRNALVHYRQYPSSLREAFRKWRISELNSVRADVRRVQHLAYLAGVPVLALLPFYSVPATALLLGTYLAVRGGVEPIRRSGRWCWWTGCRRAAGLAFVVAVCIDAGKWVGVVQGVSEKVRSPAAGR
jgi:glycosyltransferase involved in cell wall biosynthesis